MEHQVLEENSSTQLMLWDFIVRKQNVLLQVVLWWIIFLQARENGWGEVYIVLSCFYLMFANLGRRQEGMLSAYSIFNPGYRELPGTLNAQRLESELIYSRFPSQQQDNGYDSGNDPEMLLAIQNSLREVRNNSAAGEDAIANGQGIGVGFEEEVLAHDNNLSMDDDVAQIPPEYDQGYNSEEDPELLLAIQNSLEHTHGLLTPKRKDKKSKLQKRRKNVAILKTQ
mmetsp:Transcript_6013/g.7583  ORF Transcript_6013/g.7583 Transcript_6013/m.7583 type:complete len:226 (+) Transcript_6013:280-957(+)|eukprot:CAMPEP_0204826056 /NCGR_PEP_ID=MMETSP1346-20131115/3821_1 /ASSEMBLY_ACC=CAM_ASM_000771 /TAXON_ID=215587 /ORGANISM="Aplanochytrium stocchinoi, Strain GSBS06" /LENGTH=225 /DNA_ID=CAMNT_0051953909 /DNA_START=471 /DNA_END=1151 /DNA_ORIENTATION=-